MDAEHLRQTYNEYFQRPINKWSSTDIRRTLRVARKTLGWLRREGFKPVAKTLLDVGCATGFYTEAFRKLGFQSTGLDYSDVAIENARSNFPGCQFIQMNGFEPNLEQKFDVVFCRGFSGFNTHDTDFIANWANQYMAYVNDGGFLVLSYSSDFSGIESEDETVNLSYDELTELSNKIEGKYKGIYMYNYFGALSKLAKYLKSLLQGKKAKEYFYILIQKGRS